MVNYSYPLDPTWTTEETINVISFLTLIEQAYEQGVTLAALNEGYKSFKQVVDSIGAEKRIGHEFEAISGYSLYRVVQDMKQANQAKLPSSTQIKR